MNLRNLFKRSTVIRYNVVATGEYTKQGLELQVLVDDPDFHKQTMTFSRGRFGGLLPQSRELVLNRINYTPILRAKYRNKKIKLVLSDSLRREHRSKDKPPDCSGNMYTGK